MTIYILISKENDSFQPVGEILNNNFLTQTHGWEIELKGDEKESVDRLQYLIFTLTCARMKECTDFCGT